MNSNPESYQIKENRLSNNHDKIINYVFSVSFFFFFFFWKIQFLLLLYFQSIDFPFSFSPCDNNLWKSIVFGFHSRLFSFLSFYSIRCEFSCDRIIEIDAQSNEISRKSMFAQIRIQSTDKSLGFAFDIDPTTNEIDRIFSVQKWIENQTKTMATSEKTKAQFAAFG